MASVFDTIFDLVKMTGDRFIVVDKNGDTAYVAMTLEEYRKLYGYKKRIADLTENELLDKINRDIAVWKMSQEDQNFGFIDELENTIEEGVEKKKIQEKLIQSDNSIASTDIQEEKQDKYYFEPIE